MKALTAQYHWWEYWAACHLVSPRPQRSQSKPVGNIFLLQCLFYFTQIFKFETLQHDSPSPEWSWPCRSGRWAALQTHDDSFVALWTPDLRGCCLDPKGKMDQDHCDGVGHFTKWQLSNNLLLCIVLIAVIKEHLRWITNTCTEYGLNWGEKPIWVCKVIFTNNSKICSCKSIHLKWN